MKITGITEAGATNILHWAITNGAELYNNRPLQSLINDEMSYMVRLSDVSFFELFRLSQMYRDKLRILNENDQYDFASSSMEQLFPGEVKIPGEETSAKCIDLATSATRVLMTLNAQMNSDDDIIRPGAARMFIPMLIRRFDVQIPASFMDFVGYMSEEECRRMFSSSYPDSIQEIVDDPNHGAHRALSIGFMKATNPIRYSKDYTKFIRATKYSMLRNKEARYLYKIALIDFSKYDKVVRHNIRASLFKADTNAIAATLKHLNFLQTPLKLNVIIQLPIQQMQSLVSSFSPEVLPIYYESPISDIIEGGLPFNSFLMQEYEGDSEDTEKISTYENNVESYKVRIAEATQILLNAIGILLTAEDADAANVMSLLPSAYTCKAMITVDTSLMEIYLKHPDPVIKSMFGEINEIARSVTNDISKAK